MAITVAAYQLTFRGVDSTRVDSEPVRRPIAQPRVVRIPWERPRRTTVDPQQLDQAIRTATDYLVGACDAQGRFVYELDLDTGRPATSRYNVLRHAGAMYALAAAYRRSGEPRVLACLQRAAGFLRRECVAPVPGQAEMSAVWSDPRLTNSTSPRQAKLGGAGLGLVGLVELERLAPGSVPLDDLRRLGRFLVYMQKPDGSFYSKYTAETGRDDRWTSLYYPGEASLGALMLYALDGRPEWLQVAAGALGYLARPETFHHRPLPDHWMLIALEELLPLYDRAECPVSRKQLLRHARRTCLSMIDQQAPSRGDVLLDGCFGDDGRTAPTATRIEGLLAARQYLSDDDPQWFESLDRSIRSGVGFLLRCQILEGPHAGAMPMAQGPLPRSDRRSRQFNPRVRWVRIDYVQHALCAMIRYERLLAAGRSATGVSE